MDINSKSVKNLPHFKARIKIIFFRYNLCFPLREKYVRKFVTFQLVSCCYYIDFITYSTPAKYTHLHQELSKTTQDYNQLASKFDELSSIKTSLNNKQLKYRLKIKDCNIV